MKADILSGWRAYLAAHARVVERVDRELRESTGMPLEWWDVLLAVREAPGRRLRMHELAQKAVFSRSGMTRLVDRIEQAGLIERVTCPKDRRGSHAALTVLGLGELRRHWPRYTAAVELHFATVLGPEGVKSLHNASNMLAGEPTSCKEP